MKRLEIKGFIALFLFLFMVAGPGTVLAGGFLKIAGVKGEATDKNHKGWIEVTSFRSSVCAVAKAYSKGGRAIILPLRFRIENQAADCTTLIPKGYHM